VQADNYKRILIRRIFSNHHLVGTSNTLCVLLPTKKNHLIHH